MHALLRWATGTRVAGTKALATLVLRVLSGLVFISFSTGKFFRIEHYLGFYREIGLPQSVPLILLNGAAELVGGLLLVAGALTRLSALGLAMTMGIAVLTAGLSVGGILHLVVAPVLLLLMLGLVWTGYGAVAVDERVHRRLAYPVEARRP